MKILGSGEYYGSMKFEHKIGGILLSEYDYFSQSTDWHYHEHPYLMYVVQGNLFDINKKNKSYCPTGSLLFHNWEEPHLNEKHSKDARGCHIEFERTWFEDKALNINLWEGSQLINNPYSHHLFAKLYFEMKCNDAYSDISIELLLLELCESIEVTRELNDYNAPPWINSLKEMLHQEHQNLSLSTLSKELGIHPVHLSRSVPKYFRTTLGDYIRSLKIQKAIRLMMNPELSLLDITFECGFSDQSHFSRLFRLYIGVTPKQYRKRILKC